MLKIRGILDKKKAGEEASPHRTKHRMTSISHYYRDLKANIADYWRIALANRPPAERYAAADRTPLKRSVTFRNLLGTTLGLLTQARLGHICFRDYYRRCNIADRPCGGELQSRNPRPARMPTARRCQPSAARDRPKRPDQFRLQQRKVSRIDDTPKGQQCLPKAPQCTTQCSST